MRAAVDDVSHRDGENFRIRSADVFEQRLAERAGGSLSRGERDGENGVRAEFGLGFRAVELEHRGIYGELVESIHTAQRAGDLGVHIGDGFADACAEITFLVAIAKLDGFVFAGARAGRNCRATGGAAVQRDINFDGWITARIKNLARLNGLYLCHKINRTRMINVKQDESRIALGVVQFGV